LHRRFPGLEVALRPTEQHPDFSLDEPTPQFALAGRLTEACAMRPMCAFLPAIVNV
jgi:hypothetical protein